MSEKKLKELVRDPETGALTTEEKLAERNGEPLPSAEPSAPGEAVLKKALRPRDRGAGTYDAVFELEGIENVVFAVDVLPVEESEAFRNEEIELRKQQQALGAKLDDPAISEDEARDIMTTLRLMGEAHNARIDEILRAYLKGEGTPGGKITLIPEEERAEYTPSVKADILGGIIARSTLTASDAAFLSRRSR